MGLFQAFNISASGMTAERFRTDIIAQNIANVNTTSTKEGTPYRRKIVTFSEKNVTPFSQIYSSSKKAAVGNGVKVSSVTSDYSTDFIKEYDPSNPDADADGYVSYPNVNTVTEMTNLIDATRAYEANATAFEASKSMAQNGLQIGKQPAADAKQETVEPQDAVTTYTISVTSQDTCRTIAEKLKALNLVDDAEQFRIYMGQKGADHFIADGEHVIPQGASYDDIITILTQK